MLGQPLSMLVPQVVGFKLSGSLPEGATATDLVLTVTEILRKTGVVGKFVEYFGDGVTALPLADRATLGNMSPEYGATCGFFPVDELTLDYLRLTGRSAGAHRARRGLLQGEPALARPDASTRRTRRSSSSTSATSSRRSPGRAGRRTACRSRARRRRSSRRSARSASTTRTARTTRRSPTRSRPRDPTTEQQPAGEVAARAGARSPSPTAARPQPRSRAGHRLRARPRLRRDRRDHLVHEHLEPAGDGRGGAARAQRARARPAAQAVGQVLARAGLEGRDALLRAGGPAAATSTSSASTRSATAARRASATRARSRTRSRRRSTRATSSCARCSPATATSRRASIPR